MIFKALNLLPESEKHNLRKHLWECARNAPGNIAEGFGRYHYQDGLISSTRRRKEEVKESY